MTVYTKQNLQFLDTYEVIQSSTPRWEEIYSIAQHDKDHLLWENYQDIKLSQYEQMIVFVRDGITVGFHGIYNNGRWPTNFSRICNRAYICPQFREIGQGPEITSNNIKFVLEKYETWGKDVLFISRGVQYDNPKVSWRKFEKFCQYIIKTTGYKFTYDNKLYQCCATSCKDCYQFCLWYNPKGVDITVPSISIEQWNSL